MKKLATAIGLCCVLAAAPSFAQKPPDDNVQKAEPVSPKLDPKACAGDRRATIGEGDKPQVPRTDETVSEKLAATSGVICPPAEFDPDPAPRPGGNAMPVIPPPGSPGGDPSIRPK